MDDKNHMCYILLSNSGKRIYIGYTVNFARRLRQHNGEIIGGAKKTKRGRPWKPVCLISGFLDQSSALRFEYRLQHSKIKKDPSILNYIMKIIYYLVISGDGSIKANNKSPWPHLNILWFIPCCINHSSISNNYS